MILGILKWLIGAIVVIFVLLWLVDGGLDKAGAQINTFSFSAPWSWVTSTASDMTNFVTGKGIITLPGVAGVSASSSVTTAQPTPSTSETTQTEEEQLQQLQAQYQNLKAQAQAQGAVR